MDVIIKIEMVRMSTTYSFNPQNYLTSKKKEKD